MNRPLTATLAAVAALGLGAGCSTGGDPISNPVPPKPATTPSVVVPTATPTTPTDAEMLKSLEAMQGAPLTGEAPRDGDGEGATLTDAERERATAEVPQQPGAEDWLKQYGTRFTVEKPVITKGGDGIFKATIRLTNLNGEDQDAEVIIIVLKGTREVGTLYGDLITLKPNATNTLTIKGPPAAVYDPGFTDARVEVYAY